MTVSLSITIANRYIGSNVGFNRRWWFGWNSSEGFRTVGLGWITIGFHWEDWRD